MGYQRPTLRLKFDDPDLAGLEVRMRRPTVAQMIETQTLRESDQLGEDLGRICHILAASIIEWNLEDERDQAIPATAGGLLGQDMGLVIGLLDAWTKQAIGVARPLPTPSSDGDPVGLETLTMVDLPNSGGPG